MTSPLPSPDPGAFWQWILSAAAVLWMVRMTQSIWIARRGQTSAVTLGNVPLEVRGAAEFATRRDFETLAEQNRQEHSQIHAKVGGVERGMREEIRRDVGEIHTKVNELSRQVSGMQASDEHQTQQLAAISNKIDRLVERIPNVPTQGPK
jgi:hypothetical protein